MTVILAYKLFRVRADGTLGSLFINRPRRVPVGKRLRAQTYPTKGFALRHGWHALKKPHAPHLSKRGRKFYVVKLEGCVIHDRSKHQGGRWFCAEYMTVLRPYQGKT